MITRLLRRLRRDDRGIAMPVVLGLGLVMLTLVAASMATVAGGVQKTTGDEDTQSAIAAAYGGVEEYQSRLANDATYYKFGNPNAPFSASSKALLSLPAGANTNPAFNTLASQPWAKVSGSDDAWYRYQVDISQYSSSGIIRLLSSGRVGSTVQSVVANLKQKGFIDFLWFTNYEEIDPAFNAKYAAPPPGQPQLCDAYAYKPNPRPSDCSTAIQFGAFDKLDGPVHTNDTIDICGATFTNNVYTSDPSGKARIDSGCSGPKFSPSTAGYSVQYQGVLPMPPTNANLKTEARPDLPADVPNPGCLYTGPTQITFLAGGKMNVVSPYTRHTEPSGTNLTTPGTDPAKCGAIPALNSTAGATIPVLDLNLIYVQNVPIVPTLTGTDANGWLAGKTPTGVTCQSVNQTVGSVTKHSDGITFGSMVYPSVNEYLPPTSSSTSPAYSCRNGDIYVKGLLSGRTTLAADNYIYVTGDITYSDPLNDILGLVGNNAVWIWNPIIQTTTTSGGSRPTTTTTYSYGGGASNREIDAAILSVQHTFQNQNYDASTTVGLGSRGTLTVIGAIAQKYRGTVAQSAGGGSIASGYAKNYVYDQRFHYTAPPKFLSPVSTTYGVTQYAGVPAAFNADGSVR